MNTRRPKIKKSLLELTVSLLGVKDGIWDWATIEDILMVSNDFISKIVAKYQKGGIAALTANNYSGNHYKPNFPKNYT